eukprot:SAG11_NODE_2901_length_2849_cov_4.048727_2_plen_88_part_00
MQVWTREKLVAKARVQLEAQVHFAMKFADAATLDPLPCMLPSMTALTKAKLTPYFELARDAMSEYVAPCVESMTVYFSAPTDGGSDR